MLTLPVDASSHVLNYAQAGQVIERLKPKIVIPTHYLIEGTSLSISVLRTADEWVGSQRSKRTLQDSALTLSAGEIAGMDREIYYFGNHVDLGRSDKKGVGRMKMAPG